MDILHCLLQPNETPHGVWVLHSEATNELWIRSGCCAAPFAEESDEYGDGYWYCIQCSKVFTPYPPITWRMRIGVHEVIMSKWLSRWTGLGVHEFKVNVEAR